MSREPASQKSLDIPFSVVIPIYKEWDLIPKTLPTWYALNPTEVILCMDQPPDPKTHAVLKSVIKRCKKEKITRILLVERKSEYKFHQAWVRRKGFQSAKYERILTGDIDLSVTRNCLSAIRLVGESNVGAVSLRKFHVPYDLPRFYRTILLTLMRWLGYGGGFSGLYALWRPYWVETEPPEDFKQIVNDTIARKEGAKIFRRQERRYPVALIDGQEYWLTGEDAFLRDQMMQKHQILNLNRIGAIDWGPKKEEHPQSQQKQGIIEAQMGRNIIKAILDNIARIRIHYLIAFLREWWKLRK